MSNVVPDEPCARDEGLGRLLSRIEPGVAALLEAVLEGRELSAAQGLLLTRTQGPELRALLMAADLVRRRQAGETVTYVVNRNINFTNVCIKRCAFCAFSRDFREAEAYFLPLEEVVRRAKEAWELGATEVCIQAGLPPHLDGHFYVELCQAIKRAAPTIHIHAFSPEEILYGAGRSGLSIPEYLLALKEAGLGTLPGTSAEILDDAIRAIISRGRLTTRQWTDVITTAHALGIPTSATIMYGHIEQPIHWIRHMALLRDIQKNTGGFTEFVPLRLIHHEGPISRRQLVTGAHQGTTGDEALKVHALARLMLGATFKNIQASWVKEGPRLAQHLLIAGANDLGGTLINESISTSAGAPHGECMPPAELRRLIRELGRVPAERSTTYQLLKLYDGPGEAAGPLDAIDDPEAHFGSYRQLVASQTFRYAYPVHSQELSGHCEGA